jgi:hypothetical protein
LLHDPRQFAWSVANIALGAFAKLGGVPWTVDAPTVDTDIVVGIGRAEVGPGRARIFGYAMSFVSNGIYRHTWSFTPAADQGTYLARLEDSLVEALTQDIFDEDLPSRLVVHLAKRTGRPEIEAVRRALNRAKSPHVPVAYLRIDDSTLYDLADHSRDTFAPPKGVSVRLGDYRSLLQVDEASQLGVPHGPLLIELDRRSNVGPEALNGLVDQVYRLAHANWRGFNSRAKPVTLLYGEQLARLVGHLEEVAEWDPSSLRTDLRDRPWFL